MKKVICCCIMLLLGPGLLSLWAADIPFEFGLGNIRLSEAEFKSHEIVPGPGDKDYVRGHFDWRDYGIVTPAKNQGYCGACWAFAVTGVVESQFLLRYGIAYDLSEQFLNSCAPFSGCCGGNSQAFEFLMDHELVQENCYPFGDEYFSCTNGCSIPCTSVDCNYACPGIGATIQEGSYRTSNAEYVEFVRNLVSNWGPIYISYGVYHDFLTYWMSPLGTAPWTDGVYVNYPGSEYEGGHAVLLIGYDEEESYYICKNSWGESGGPFGDGTFKIRCQGHAEDVLWNVAFADVNTSPDTPAPTATPTVTPTKTPTPIPPVNDSCPGTDLYPDTCVCGNSIGAYDSFDCGVGFNGGDVVFHLTNLQTGAIYQLIGDAEYNADWAISTVCNNSSGDVLCLAGTDYPETPQCSTLTANQYGFANFEWIAYQTEYWIWVDSQNSMITLGEYCVEVKTVSTPTPTPTRAPQVIRVPADYGTIQAAINAAENSDTVMVSDGTYSGTGNTNIRFYGKQITVRSENGPENCVLDCENNSRAFIFDYAESSSSILTGFKILNAWTAQNGGAVYCDHSNPLISYCFFDSNTTTQFGGAIALVYSNAEITACEFKSNEAGSGGGAIQCYRSNPEITNCLMESNFATNQGGAVLCQSYSNPSIKNCTIYDNESDNIAGGICSLTNSNVNVINSILWLNQPEEIVATTGAISVTYSDIYDGWTGTGNISSDPLFVSGTHGAFYLDYSSAPASPCINAGGSSASVVCFTGPYGSICMNELTTRTDEVLDSGTVDMGYHYHGAFVSTPTPTMTPTPTFTPTAIPGIYVPDDYSTIQAAIDAASNGDTVIVRDGTWTGVGNRNLSMEGKAITLRSLNGPEACIIDCENEDIGFTIDNEEDESTIIQGFTVQNGFTEVGSGGGMKMYDVSVIVTNCVIQNNSAYSAGGISIIEGAPVISNCKIRNNTTQSDYSVGGGIGISSSDVTLINCLITGNTAKDGGGVGISGGYPTAEILNCTIYGNTAHRGAGIYTTSCDLTLRDSIVTGNLEGKNLQTITGSQDVTYSDIEQASGVYPGTGNINVDPIFTTGLEGEYYLDFLSPCFDAGSDAPENICFADSSGTVCMDDLTTQITGQADSNLVDIGFHYPKAEPNILHVPSQYQTIQLAIDAAQNADIVLVASGTYTGTGNFDLNYKGKSITVKSADGPDNCIIDAEGNGRGFIFVNGETGLSVLEGFTITHGNANYGGALICDDSSPLITNCRFTNNSANVGGAMMFTNSTADITDCLIQNNTATHSGGVHVYVSAVKMYNCLFISNTGNTTGGGVVFEDSDSPHPVMKNCTIHGNSSPVGGGVYSTNSSPFIQNVIVFGNSDSEMYFTGAVSPSVQYCCIQGGWGQPSDHNIDADPDFTTGPGGDYYLNSRLKLSPCFDKGSANSNEICFPVADDIHCLDQYTTKTTQSPDTGIVDIGFHYPVLQSTPTPTPTPSNPPTATPGSSILHVPSDFANIQAAVNAADSGDTVLVADGTYTGIGNFDITFMGKNVTVVSETGPFTCVVDCRQQGRGFLFSEGERDDSILSGFKIINGKTNASGGAILCDGTFPKLCNLIISGNRAGFGGGVSCINDAHPTLINCLIKDNGMAQHGGGGGIYSDDSNPVFGNCTIVNNSAIATFPGEGGGFLCVGDSIPVLINCIAYGNQPETVTMKDHSSMDVRYSDVAWDGVFPGTGNINVDPRFRTGVLGYFYLDTRSLCINTGDRNSNQMCFPEFDKTTCLDELTVRVDGSPDTNVIDMGFHYPLLSGPTATPGTPTFTPTPIATRPPTITPRPTYTYAPTYTPRPTATYTPRPTITPTYTMRPTITPPPPTSTPAPSTTPTCIHSGDANLDSFVSAADAQLAFRIALLMYTPSYEEACAADCNGDEHVTSGDAQQIFLTALGLSSCVDDVN